MKIWVILGLILAVSGCAAASTAVNVGVGKFTIGESPLGAPAGGSVHIRNAGRG
jgi:hypothetical protein